MPNNYQIIVTNNNSDPTNYLVFCAAPNASDNIGKAWTNIWAQTPGVAPKGGNTTIKITADNYAVCGMAPQQLAPGVNISTNQSVAVTLGPGNFGLITAVMDHGGLMFEGDVDKTGVVGGYEIHTKTWTNAQYPAAFCGFGKVQPFSSPPRVIPVAAWTAKSTSVYKVYPKIMYYITTGDYVPGDIVDVATFGSIANVDFTGKSESVAYVTQLDDGTYGPVKYGFAS